MLTPTEHHQLVFPWNRTATDYPRDHTVHSLFERQAQAAPDSIALEFGDQRLSYGELNRRANRLAHYLLARGVAREDRIGLMLEPGAEMVVAMLGILKAGGAYLPLDPDYPAARLAFMLEDSRAALLLNSSNLTSRLPEFGGEQVVLDRDYKQIQTAPGHDPELDCGAQNLAYVIYTSGSTGTPKGVEIMHRAINRLVKNTNYYQVGDGDRILQASNISFDAATFEIWGALLNGARLVGIDRQCLLDPRALAAALRERSISAMFVTTAVFNQVAREVPSAFGSLEAVMFGGEAADCDAVRRVLENQPPRRLLHVYGPTESTTFASWYPVTAVSADDVTVPIGYPLANTTLYVLDLQLQPLPPGVPGELYIGGDGLARGYLNRPELTAERFIDSPFEAGAQLYRSGDKVRYRDDGAIEFIGRFDNQVKLRGFRIELGEVETALRSLPAVDDAVVALREVESGDRQLVAYVVAGGLDSAELSAGMRAELEQILPPYMVPGFYVRLDALPLTPNGKVDREALPQPGTGRAAGARPRSRLERQLAEIWAQVLGLQQVGIDEPFLELGGHSLLASRVVTRIREELGVDLKLSDFYRGVDVENLARLIDSLECPAVALAPAVIEPAPREWPLPVSFSQEQVIFLNLLAPGNLAYNTQMSIRFDGKLDFVALQRALDEILRRHEIFRTSFELVDGVAYQRIHPHAGLELEHEDLSTVPQAQRETRLQQVVAAEIGRSFDIESLPLVRWKLIKLGAEEHRLLHVEHHLVHDGWSFGVFLRELQDLYSAYASGQESPLAELPIQFADYVIWQRQRLQGDRLQRLLKYWQTRLAPPLPLLQLPTDFPRPPQQSHRGAELVVDLPPALADRLRELSSRENTTLYVTALTIFFILLHKYSNQQDIVIGTGVANRPLSEVEGLIGMFVNAVPLRADLTGDPSFGDLIRRIQAMAFEAYEHQELPLEKLVETLPLDRDLASNPLFQVLFSFHDSQVPVLECPGLRGNVEYLHNGSAKFDINLVVIPWAEQVVGLDDQAEDRRITMKWEYATDLFSADTIAAMTRHYQNLLRELVRDPRRPLSELSMLEPGERRQLLCDWNRTATDYPRDQTVHRLFERQAAAAPEAIALDYQGDTLTYGELNARANRLARYLQMRGVGPEVLVGLMLDRSLELVVATLGILKAGGAYLPLDPIYPQARLEFILQDAQAPVVVTQSSLGDRLPEFAGDRVYLDRDWLAIERESSQDTDSGATSENLIYAMYTSGSTGRPKGTLIEHRSAVRLVRNTNYAELGADEVFLQFAPISFDASTFELWGSLLNGARLVIYPSGHTSLDELGRFIRRNGITTLWLTSALFNQLVDNHLSCLSGVRQLLAGGEALSPPHVRKMLEQLDGGRLINGYGPTENTTFTCCHVMTKNSSVEHGVPIGQPISNTTVYILDKQMQPVPVGVPGELYIGGDGLARGYLNRPELTAERFIDSPFEAGARLYRTGDEVRYRNDGFIEFIGRFDNQVKLRGYRIELGEVETALRSLPAVDDAVVALREVESGDRQLVAYVVAGGLDSAELSAGIRAELEQILPPYMVPGFYVRLDALPLTPNGKVDREALPKPEGDRDTGDSYIAPSTPLERQLVEIWEEVLGFRPIGVRDNFFELGGHSLVATRVISRISSRLELQLPVAALFAHPDIASLAHRIETLQLTDAITTESGQDGEREELRL